MAAAPLSAARLAPVSESLNGTMSRPAMQVAPAQVAPAKALSATSNVSAPGYQIEVVFPDNSLTPTQRAAFTTAANRWQQILTGDIPDIPANPQTGAEVDDVRITATAPYIDGPGRTLGSAGPRFIRNDTFLPITGDMQFDSADVLVLEANGSLGDVILHEMGHVLGVGTIWDLKTLLSGEGTADPRYTGSAALAEYNAIFGQAERSIPVENTGGEGTRDSHWRDTVFGNELMTGFLDSGANPLSRVTAAQFVDLGYPGVVVSAADPFTPPTPVVTGLTDGPEPAGTDGTLALTATGVSDPNGNSTITGVRFYRETNSTPGLQANGAFGGATDTLLATDTSASGGYTASVSLAGLAAGTYTYYAQATDTGGAQGSFATTTNTIVPPPTVLSVQLNDGNVQRSKINAITVTFSQPVVLDAGAITLVGRNGAGSATTLNVAPGTGPAQSYVLTFSGASVIGGSLADGIYDLTVVGAKVHAGSAAGPTMAADSATKFHRLFADADGDGDVDNADRFELRSTTNKREGNPAFKWYFDYDGDADVDNADLFEVRGRARIAFRGY